MRDDSGDDSSGETGSSKSKTPNGWHTFVDSAAGLIVTLLLIAGGVAVVINRDSLFAPRVGWFDAHLFWVLALVPSVVAIVNYWVAERRRYERGIDELKARKQEVQQVAESRSEEMFDDHLKQVAVSKRLDLGIQDGRRPLFAYTLLGAALLATVFGIAAQLSSRSPECGDYGIGPKVSCRLAACDDCSLGSRREEGIAPPVAANEDAGHAAGTDSSGKTRNPEPARGGTREAIVALVFASYGAFAYTLRAMIGRLNASALSGRFLVRLAMQSAGTVVLGFVIGYVGAASVVASERQSLFLYFLIGMFPAWATQLIAARAREVFSTPEAGCEHLPLCLIDGIDDDVTDRLSEANVWDIQHLATSDPIDLTLRTQYPLDRILDWIDQAILVTYVRTDIAQFRTLGLRGAIDLAILASDNLAPENEPATAGSNRGDEMRRDEATEVFRLIVELTKVKRPLMLAQSLFEDAAVDFVWRLWQRTRA